MIRLAASWRARRYHKVHGMSVPRQAILDKAETCAFLLGGGPCPSCRRPMGQYLQGFYKTKERRDEDHYAMKRWWCHHCSCAVNEVNGT